MGKTCGVRFIWHSFTTQTFKIPGARREWILSADPSFFQYFQYDTWDNQRSLDLFDLTWHWIPIGEVLGTGVSLILKSIIQEQMPEETVSIPIPRLLFSPSPLDMYLSQRIHGFFRNQQISKLYSLFLDHPLFVLLLIFWFMAILPHPLRPTWGVKKKGPLVVWGCIYEMKSFPVVWRLFHKTIIFFRIPSSKKTPSFPWKVS